VAGPAASTTSAKTVVATGRLMKYVLIATFDL
jgi:hypothetical protein